MRRFAFILAGMLVWLSTGCTSSDRDYIRNHIVLLESQKSQSNHLGPSGANDDFR